MNQSEYNAVPVGEGYRELKLEETVAAGDMLLSTSGSWGPVTKDLRNWFVQKVSVGHKPFQARFRRPINA